MGIGIVSGVNWSVEGKVFSIFGQRGYVKGENWIMPSLLLSPALQESDPTPASGEILTIIEQDVRDGNADKIAYVGVNPRTALRLALEGVLTADTLSAATETPDRIICTVTLGGTERSLVVLEDTNFSMATYDLNNEVV